MRRTADGHGDKIGKCLNARCRDEMDAAVDADALAIRALQQVYAATHPAAFLEKEKAPPVPEETPWPGDPTAADLSAALEQDAEADREE